MQYPTISYLTNVQFGAGSLVDLPEVIQRVGMQRPLVVTDGGLLNRGFVERLNLNNPVVFSEIETNPTEASVLLGVEAYRREACDGIIALGGGSPMDAAKGIGIMATHDLALEDMAFICGGLEKITSEVVPIIAIPTTSGTGSEVGRGALISMASGQKLAIISPHIIPKWSIVDPELTLELPPLLTAATGMDALSHCLETYCSNVYNPVAGAIAIDGLRRGWSNIKTVVDDGQNIVARSEMMMCAMQGALSFQKGLGVIHAVSHPLGALRRKRLHHGTLNAVFMPHAIRFNLDSARQETRVISSTLGISSGTDGLADAFSELNRVLGLPQNLEEMGIDAGDLDGIAEQALRDHCGFTNPRTLTLKNLESLLKSAL
ncbi:MAG: iron-containing alcohol dehydrogenase [Planctomycetaceae bacterium]|jgi:4-hydroxybutyrate dehydrogenase|nr:iron-containing alcohol dehydrogenase [Planctomycetaceae bacterium]MBT4725524.1 iron-containing alcohol dehydrogenase [Planctomycetaceae bacterium]MBT5125526.1 iron-containing alcohol dehydrogenase [Planctomycetaceae bacterium]MBT5599752.1 iron-containing alcohol dehydrogenase [Planctomycetaceae bacterium]MBT5885269.1 iron-containing alcohol dehydrogenase [Planctomycetaceae bacterium]